MSRYVHLKRLEYAVTYRCTSRCRHCYAPSVRPGSAGHVEAGLAVRVLRELSQQHALESVMTFGGEPLLYPDVVCAIHAAARDLAIPSREVITNGFWTRSEGSRQAVARALVEAGVTSVLISVDAVHQEYVPLGQVKRSAQALWEAGLRDMRWNPCWLASETDPNPYNLRTSEILAELASFLPIPCDAGNVMQPQGKALEHFAAYFRPRRDWAGASCQDMPYTDRPDAIRSLCLDPGGEITLCGQSLGNLNREGITAILERHDPYQDVCMRAMLCEGSAGLLREAQALGIELRAEGYHTLCDLCQGLRQGIAVKSARTP